MRRCAIFRPATPATALFTAFALSLTTLSALAGTLDPIRLRVSGKEVALKSPAVTDGHETYIPLDALSAFGASCTLTRREETAIVTLPNGLRTEVALARPGRLPMAPLSALAKPLGIVYENRGGVCDIRREGERPSSPPVALAQRPEPIKPAAEKRQPVAETVRQTSPNLSVSVQGVQAAGSTNDQPKVRMIPAQTPDRTVLNNKPPESRIHLDLPDPKIAAGRTSQISHPVATSLVQQPGGLGGTGDQDPRPDTPPAFPLEGPPAPVASPIQGTVNPLPNVTRIEDVTFEKVSANVARIRFRSSGRVSPSALVLSDSNRLAIDVPNAALGSDRRDWDIEHPFLSAIHASESERPGSIRFVLDLSRLVSYRLLPADSNGFTLNLAIPRGGSREVRDLTVVVDAGHGGSEGKNPVGCSIVSGGQCIMEKHLTLSIARKLQTLLEEEGATVLMTRTKDISVSLTDRPLVAVRNGADLFVSVHIDDCPRANSASGTTAYYSNVDPNGRALARSIVDNIAAVSGLPNRRARSDRERFAGTGMAVLHTGAIPSTLVEIGYINNARDRAKLVNPEFQETIAQAMLDGIRGYVAESMSERVAGPMVSASAAQMR